MIVLLGILCCMFCFCGQRTDPEDDARIADTFRLTAWVLDEDLEGTGYFSHDEEYGKHYNGHWVLYDGEQRELNQDAVFRLEEIKPGVKRTLAPMGYDYEQNINLHFEFDGTIEVATDPPLDNTLQLAYSTTNPDFPQCGNWTIANPIGTQQAPLAINVCPVGEEMVSTDYILRDTPQFREYTLLVTASMQNGMEVLTARVELCVLNDRYYPYEKVHTGGGASGEPRSRFLSIEITEILYSDQYLLTYGD